MAHVSLQGVGKTFPGGSVAVENFSLEAEDGEFVVLVGPSGCGKSTTLRMIAGLETAGSGEIRIGGKLMNRVAPKDRDVAMVFQNYALYPHKSVYGNLSFGLQLRYGGWFSGLIRRMFRPQQAAEIRKKRREIPTRVQAAAEMLGIDHLLARMPAQLSGGERQRVALGRALVRKPAVFLFDEPLSNLDARLRAEMRREIKLLHREIGATMIYVTHDQVEAMTLGDRIVVMQAGKVEQIGTPHEVYHRPKNIAVAKFIGTPAMNLVAGRLHNSSQEWYAQGSSWKLGVSGNMPKGLKPGQAVVLGVRPEDLQLVPAGENSQGWRCRIELVESLGDASLVHLAFAENAENGKNEKLEKADRTLVARVTGSPPTGGWVEVHPRPDRLHWFDADDGENLVLREE